MHYDVIVCGGGPSGTAAALQSARSGAKTILIERYGFLGGNATAALVNPWLGHAWADPDTKRRGSLIGGIFREIIIALRERDSYGARLGPSCFDEEQLKVIYDHIISEAGVTLRLHSLLVGADRNGDRIIAVDIAGKDGIRKIHGKVFIDATGDGDLAAMAGCSYDVGRPSDGLTQAMTMSFRMAGVDKTDLFSSGNLKAARQQIDPLFQQARESGRLNYPHRDFVQFYDYPRPGVLHFNMTRINRVIGLSPEELTRAEVEGRRQAKAISDWLINDAPPFKNAWLEKLACHVGVRETRHIKGLYAFTQSDVAEGKKFDDAIARSRYFIDIHSPTGAGFDHSVDGNKGAIKTSYAPPPYDWYEIPYRAIVSADLENLLTPCRALSATYEGAAAVRVMATMTALGQAAGLAAARTSRSNKAAAEINCGDIRSESGYLDEAPEIGGPWE